MAIEHQKWITKLLRYDFEVEYRHGVEKKAADALSRIPKDVVLDALSISRAIILEDLQQQVHSDESLRKLILDLERDQSSQPGYTLVQDQLRFNDRLVLPKGTPIITILLQEYHNGPTGGHVGVLKTYKRLKAEFY